MARPNPPFSHHLTETLVTRFIRVSGLKGLGGIRASFLLGLRWHKPTLSSLIQTIGSPRLRGEDRASQSCCGACGHSDHTELDATPAPEQQIRLAPARGLGVQG